MPDFYGVEEATDSWHSTLDPARVHEVAVQWAEKHKGKVSVHDSSLQIAYGNRDAYRTLGILLPFRSLPIQLTMTALGREEGGTEVTVTAVCDPGWYAFNAAPGVAKWQFQRAFQKYFRELRKELDVTHIASW